MNNVNHSLLSNLFIIITANNYSRSTYKAVYTCISDQTELLSSWRLAVEQTANPNKQVIRIAIMCAWNWNSPKMARQARTNDSSNNFKFYFSPTSNKKTRTYPINRTYIIQHQNEKVKSKRQRLTQRWGFTEKTLWQRSPLPWSLALLIMIHRAEIELRWTE